MSARDLLFAQSIVLAITAALYFLGFSLYLYWVFWWYDIMLHFLGGIWVGFAVIWLFSLLRIQMRWSHIIALVIAIGIVWEIFELSIGLPREKNYQLDTSIDLLMDVFGGFASILFVKKKDTAAGVAEDAR